MIKIVIFVNNYSVFEEPHFVRNLRENFEASFDDLFNSHQMSEGKTEKSESIE